MIRLEGKTPPYSVENRKPKKEMDSGKEKKEQSLILGEKRGKRKSRKVDRKRSKMGLL